MNTQDPALTIGKFIRMYTTKADSSARNAFKKIEEDIYINLQNTFNKKNKTNPNVQHVLF
ncbi:hypothetical protein [Photobacterium sp. GB-50]|uniref:hypothetical protein n=1 Tax=Photobacterium sp. GB-50 TaxID=2022107 RepID=UPI0011B24456|nr:hypothetical protein [Photobacterium sp. GB-50]